MSLPTIIMMSLTKRIYMQKGSTREGMQGGQRGGLRAIGLGGRTPRRESDDWWFPAAGNLVGIMGATRGDCVIGLGFGGLLIFV